jgi:NAD(P)-dependent dehydrogenase (short-subunit alcohol dehydrogenase family)
MTDPLFDVNDKSVVLTGACGLIGRTLATALAQRGARLVLADLDAAALEEVNASIEGNHTTFEGNLARSENVASLVNVTVRAYGRVDVLINCHQYKPSGFLSARAETFPEELWDAIIEANLKGTFLTCRDFGRVMLDQKAGSIINFASTYGVVSSNPSLYADNSLGNPVAYSASKGGVIMLTKYLASYWGKKGVRVNCITPHGVENNHEQEFVDRFSQMSPLGRMMVADEVVGAVMYLASDASRYSTGGNLLVDGGWTAW